jgi:gamma-glutamylcyclotransferase (GGCT)/AIG2-like uncharacterized protein YtfP
MCGEGAYSLVEPHVLAVAPAQLTGVDLYSLGAYPLAVCGRGHIVGELLWLRAESYDAVLCRLDAYEGPQYTRKIRHAQDLTRNTAVAAWVYLGLQPPQLHHPRIIDGDWRAHRRRTGP